MKKCYLCGADTLPLYEFNNVKGKTFSIYNCGKCGLLRTSPLHDKKELKTIYGKKLKYDVKKQSEVFRSNFLERLKEKLIVRPLLSDLLKSFDDKKNLKLLDIGCSTGWITSIAQDIGFDVKGLEANPNSAAIARDKFGLKVYEGFVEDFNFEDGFHAVTMFHVLEHFADPISVLKIINKILRQNGKLLIVVPNAESVGTKIFKENYNWNVGQHISFFSKNSLELMLQKAGFKVIKSKTLISTPMLINSFNKMMRQRKKEGKLSFRIKKNVLGNFFMFPLGVLGKYTGRGEVLAIYVSK